MIFDVINNRNPGFITSDSLDMIKEPGTYTFLRGDSEFQFKDNLKVKPKDWYYRTNKVEYTLNSDRFRTKEFKDIDWKNSIVLVGCSMTFGLGITDEDTIAAHLQKITGKNVVNLGQTGISNSVIAYNSYYLKENYPTPLAVVNIWTSMMRWWYINYNKIVLESYDYDWSTDDVSSVFTEDKMLTQITNNILYMKMSNALWKDHPNHLQLSLHDYHTSGRYISIAAKVFPEVIQLKQSWVDCMDARDCCHWGRETTKKVTKLIASNLKL